MCITKGLEYLIQGVPVNKNRRPLYQVSLISNHMMPFDDTYDIVLALGDHATYLLQFGGTEQCGKQLLRVTMFEGSYVFRFGPCSQSLYR